MDQILGLASEFMFALQSSSKAAVDLQECVILAWWFHKLTLKLADDYPEDQNMQSLGVSLFFLNSEQEFLPEPEAYGRSVFEPLFDEKCYEQVAEC